MRARRAFLALFLLSLLGTAAFAGGPITSGATVSGTLTAPTYSETWTFSGTNGDRVLIAAVTTNGSVNTLIRLRNPGGTEVVATATDRVDYQLLATGVYTLIIEDSGLNDPGTYGLSFLNVTAGPYTDASDPDGGALASAEVRTGNSHVVSDFDAYTFSATAGDRVLLAAPTTGGTSHNTNIVLYPPGGGAQVFNSGTGDRMDIQVTQTGTYVAVIEDFANDHAGSYGLSLMNVTAGPWSNGSDPDGGVITSSQVTGGSYTGLDFDAYRFNGTAGDRVLVAMVATGAGGHNTMTYLYPPNGGAPIVASGTDRTDHQLPLTGTYTIVTEESGYDHTGNYSLSLLNVTAGPYTDANDPDGGALASAEVRAADTDAGVDFDAYTFFVTAGDRVLLAAPTTGGTGHNTNIVLYPPNGGAQIFNSGTGDRMDIQIGQTGTYVAVIEDSANDHAGSYAVSLLNVTAGPWSNGADPDGGVITSSQVAGGSYTRPDFDAYRFSGSAGDRILIAMVATGAGGHNTMTYLYPPNGGAPIVASGTDRTDHQLPLTGTYTIVTEEAGYDHTGTYSLSLLNVTAGPYTDANDPDGGPMASAEVRSGDTDAGVDFDAYTFSVTAGDRVVLGAPTTGGASHNTNIVLYPPNGGAQISNSGTGDRMDIQLTQTGTYVAVVEDAGNDHAGSYSVTLLNVTAGPWSNGSDPDGGVITSSQVTGGSYSGLDFDAYRFSGTAGDRVLIAMVATGAGGHNTVTYLYPPNGGAPLVASGTDRTDHQLPLTGTYTIVTEEAGYDQAGTYALSLLNVTAGPYTDANDPDGGPMASAEVRSGDADAGVDFDAYTFSATMGDRVVLAAPTSGGASHNTNIVLYPPNGGAQVFNSGTGDRMDIQLTQTGTYVAVIEDAGNDHAGSYGVTLLNVTAGPWSNGADPDGGVITSSQVTGGSYTGLDFDAYRFNGTSGDRVLIAMVATGAGGHNTVTYLYPPNGGAPLVAAGTDRTDHQLPLTGTYTIVTEEAGYDQAGTYALSLLNVTAGPYTDANDPDGGALASAEVRSGDTDAGVDFDAYTLSVTAGDRVVLGAPSTGGASHNTNIVLYPPNGGAQVFNSGTSDRMDIQVTQTGTYVAVIEDAANDHAGSYRVSLMNVTSGPFASATDPDGYPIGSRTTYSANIDPSPDFDAFPFQGATGDSVIITAVATAPGINTMIYLYPPNGAAPVIATGSDIATYSLVTPGVYTIVIGDAGLDNVGPYDLTLDAYAMVSDVPDTAEEVGDLPLDPVRLVLQAPRPNPFHADAHLRFSIPTDRPVSARVFDSHGRLVRVILDAPAPAGTHDLTWDGRDSNGEEMPSGVYHLQLRAGTEVARQRLVRLR